MIILNGMVGSALIAIGLASFLAKKNRGLSIISALLGLMCFMFLGLMLYAMTHFGEVGRDDGKLISDVSDKR